MGEQVTPVEEPMDEEQLSKWADFWVQVASDALALSKEFDRALQVSQILTSLRIIDSSARESGAFIKRIQDLRKNNDAPNV